MEGLSLLLALLGGGVCGWQLRSGRGSRPGRLAMGQVAPPAEQLRRWIEAAPQGWLLLAPDHTIAALTPRAEQLLDLAPGLGQPGQAFSTLEPCDELRHLIELSGHSGLAQRGSWLRSGQNLEVWVLPGDGGWRALILEGRHRLEAQIEQQERWVSDVSHELKTPITALMLVGESLASQTKGQHAVLVARLQRELRRLQLLVSDLLDLSRLENTPAELEAPAELVNPSQVLHRVWAMLEPLAQDRQIHLQQTLNQPLLAAVHADRLHQALLNLLDNALRYSPEGAGIEVSISKRQRWCLISVRDQGPGLSNDDLKHLFERFYRGDPSRYRGPRTGSGLGLAIVKQIAHAHGGLVRARNHPGGGAVLELMLPLG